MISYEYKFSMKKTELNKIEFKKNVDTVKLCSVELKKNDIFNLQSAIEVYTILNS